MKKYITKNEKDTLILAKKIARDFKGGETLALIGELGSGKTVFTKGVAKELGVKEDITSPTFNIMKVYSIPSSSSHSKLCHIDAYRLKKSADLKNLGLDDYLKDITTITLIEWADKIEDLLPKNTLLLTFKQGKKDNERIITVTVKTKGRLLFY